MYRAFAFAFAFVQKVAVPIGVTRIVASAINVVDAPIISTREVPPQQKIIGKRKAKEIRLKLMNERKRHKQSLNPRSVSLCEH